MYLHKKQAKKLLPDLNYDLLPSQKEVAEITTDLKDLTDTINDIECRFKFDRLPFSSQMVIDKLKESKSSTKKKAATNLVFKFMEEYLADHKTAREVVSLSAYHIFAS